MALDLRKTRENKSFAEITNHAVYETARGGLDEMCTHPHPQWVLIAKKKVVGCPKVIGSSTKFKFNHSLFEKNFKCVQLSDVR